MNDEALIRKLIRGSVHRAIQESIAALVVGIFGVVFAGVIWLNRRASICIEESAKLLTD